MTGASDYRAFGLKIRSDIELPELFPADDENVPDVRIRRGSIEPAVTGPEIRADGKALLLTIPNIARYRIEGGREILVDPFDDVPDRNLRLFLLGSAFGALLHQRGYLPLHANAVEVDGRAVAFMGEAGAGKSTLAAWFHDRGFAVVADDVCVVGFGEDGVAYAYPGLPRLRLWDEALSSTGRLSGDYDRSYVGPAEQLEKFDVPIDRSGAVSSRLPLAAVFLLERGEAFSVDRVAGMEAAEAIFANTYRGAYLNVVGNQERHWSTAIALVRSVPLYRFRREWGLSLFDDQCRRLVDALRDAAS